MFPLVSVIMPARNVERYIDTAINSVRRQTLASLELIVIDDGSSDQTAEIVQRHAGEDARVRLLSGHGLGPGAARNLGIEAAAGRWVAVVDADDEILPERLTNLVAAAADRAHLVADNLTAFYESGQDEHSWLSGKNWQRAHLISLKQFFEAGIDGEATDQPGYLKPLFDRVWLEQRHIRYDETMAIGEDYDLVARALAHGAVYQFIPQADYRYRRHPASTSHRIRPEQLATMVAGFERLRSLVSAPDKAALDRRIQSLLLDQRFLDVVADLKAHSPAAVLQVLAHGGLRRRLFRAMREGLGRRLSKR